MTSIIHVGMTELRSLSVSSLDAFLAGIIVDLHTMQNEAGPVTAEGHSQAL